MDKFEQIAADCPVSFGILGNPVTLTVELIRLDNDESPKLSTPGLCWLGVCGFDGTNVHVALASEVSLALIQVITAKFVQRVAAVVAPLKSADVSVLEKWLALPDLREN
jgi:hypothetical protein